MKIATTGLLLATVLLSAGGAATPSHAACFESGIGCTDDHRISRSALNALSCDALWTVRNTIYDERGYCFRTERALESFSNDDCSVTNASALAFNSYERANVSRIVAVERQKGCR